MKFTRNNYCWVIIVLCFEIFFLFIGLGTMPKNLYIVPVTEHFNFSRGEFSLAYTVAQFIGLAVQFSYGFLEKRFGVRRLVVIGVILIPMGYFLYSMASSIELFYAGAILISISGALSTITSVSILINNWVKPERHGIALGLITAGSGFGGSLFSLFVGHRIVSHGFQSSYFITSIILALGAIPVIIFIRSKPTDPSLKQREEEKRISRNPIKLGNPFSKTPDYFWITMVSVFLIGIVIGPTNSNTPGFIIEKGFDETLISKIISAILFVQAITKIILGYVNDRLGVRFCLYAGLGAYVIGTIILLLARETWMLWVYAFFGGISMSAFTMLIPLFVEAMLNHDDYTKYISYFMAVMSGGSSIGDPIINYVFDYTGTYKRILSILTVVGLLALVLSLISLKKKSAEFGYTPSDNSFS